VAGGATVGQTGPDNDVCLNIGFAVAVAGYWTLPLISREFPLEELAPPADGAKRIAGDDEPGAIWSHGVAGARANLLSERLGNTFIGSIGVSGSVRQLSQ